MRTDLLKTDEQLREAKMRAFGLRPRPFIFCCGGRYCFRVGISHHFCGSLAEAIATLIAALKRRQNYR